MSKAVLMSIQPRFCELIANGKKTIEIRKTKPKLQPPFKVYIYETKAYDTLFGYGKPEKLWVSGGRVIGEFVCDEIVRFENKRNDLAFDKIVVTGCIEPYDLAKYMLPQCYAYAWHITNLVIYDQPKELSEFCKGCDDSFDIMYGSYCKYCDKRNKLTRPPRSWCYVEELDNDR